MEVVYKTVDVFAYVFFDLFYCFYGRNDKITTKVYDFCDMASLYLEDLVGLKVT